MQIAYIWHATKSIIFGVLIDFLHLTFQFAFASLIILNGLMDLWICFKICVILYWALISEDWRIAYQEKSLPQTAFFQPNLFFTNIFFTFVNNKIDSRPEDFLIFSDDGNQNSEDLKLKFMSFNVTILCKTIINF